MEASGNWQTCPRCKSKDVTDFSTCKFCGCRYDARPADEQKSGAGWRMDERFFLGMVFLIVGLVVAVQLHFKHQANQAAQAEMVAAFSKTDKPKVIEFYADWCGPCRQYGPVVDACAKKYSDRVFFARLNVDDPASRELTKAFEISAIPRTFFINSKGKTVDDIRGAVGADVLEERVQKLADGN